MRAEQRIQGQEIIGAPPESGETPPIAIPRGGLAARLAGGPATNKLEFTTSGRADPLNTDLVLATVRRVTAKHGTARRTGSLLEWSSGGRSRSLMVNVAPGEGGSVVMILVDRSTDATVLTVVAAAGAGVSIGLAGTFLQPAGFAAGAGLVVGIAAVWAVAARTYWARSTRRWRSMLARLTTAIVDSLDGRPAAP